MDRRVKIGLGVGAGCMLVCVLVGVAIVGGLLYSVRDPESITVSITAPDAVAVNEDFSIEVAVQNGASRAQTLEEIALNPEYAEAVYISSADPAFYESILGAASNLQRYKFSVEIPANSTLTILLNASARLAGDHVGDLEVCVESASRCLNYSIRTVVSP